MPHPKAWKLPKPENHQEFEGLCLDIVRARKKPLVEPNLYGRSGQKQHGVDFTIELPDGLHGYQCKSGETINGEEVEAEVGKTASFPNRLESYTVLTAADRDTAVQDAVTALSQQRQADGLFPVAVVFWSTIQDWLAERLDVLRAHYPDVDPNLIDLMKGAGSRLEEEFPGSSLEFKASGEGTQVVLRPGPGGVPFGGTVKGREAVERFRDAMKEGQPFELNEQEFEIHLPDALEEYSPQREGRKVTFSFRPHPPVKSKPVRLVIEPTEKFGSLEVFAERGKNSLRGYGATLTVSPKPGDRIAFDLQVGDCPLQLTFEAPAQVGLQETILDVMADYVGASVDRALEAERLLQVGAQGAYVGIFDEKGAILAGNADLGGIRDDRFIGTLGVLAELADLTGWDLRVPERLERLEVAEAARVLELLRTGRTVVGYGFTITVIIDAGGQQRFRDAFDKGSGSLSLCIPEGAREVELLGEPRPMPRTQLELQFDIQQVQLSDEMLDRINNAEPPFAVELRVTDDVEVVRTMVPDSTSIEPGDEEVTT